MPLKISDICKCHLEDTAGVRRQVIRNLFRGIDAWGPIKFKNSCSGITVGIDHLQYMASFRLRLIEYNLFNRPQVFKKDEQIGLKF